MNIENCPNCPNHCPKDNLGCGRGRAYFNLEEKEIQEPKTLNEQVIADIRKCGHILHHNRDINVDETLSSFTEEELKEMHELLSKFYQNINN